jgi:hypothetical protein
VLAGADCGSSGTTSATPTGHDAGVVSDAGAVSDAAPVPALPNTDAGAVASLQPETWTWVPVDGARCRDGSATGFGISVNPSSDKLAIFLQGGGACFNEFTCLANPSSYGESDFTSQFTGPAGGGTGNAGLLDRTDMANPVKDWNLVFVPYCSGDVFSGYATDVTVPGVSGKQQFVGYANMHLALERIVPTFPKLGQVLLTGVSAGGFGAAANLEQTATAFGSVPVGELDDSGPSMSPPDVASCLLDNTRKLWGIDNTLIAACGSDCPDPSNYLSDYTHHLLKKYPTVPFGLVDTVGDAVISLFFGSGNNNCASALIPTSLTQAQYTKGLDDIRMAYASDPKFGSFIFGDDTSCNCATQHTSLGGSTLDTVQSTSGVKLSDWVTQLIAGTVTNVGP